MNAQDLKNSILQLAIQGKLVEQREEEGTAKDLLKQIKAEKERLIKEKKIKKEKPLPEITEDEIPFDIPESWEWVRLSSICMLSDGESVKSVLLPYLEARYIRGKCEPQMKNSGKYVGENQYVILVDGENSGEIFLTKEEGILGSTFKLLQIIQPMYDQYIVKALSYYQKMFRDRKKGAAIPHLDKALFKNLVVGLPPLEEQRRIVARIEELMPYIDKYGESYLKLDVLNKKFPEDMQKSILQYAIQGKLVGQRAEEGTAEELYQQIQEEKARLIKVGKIKKDQSLAEIRADEIPFEIKESWKWVRLGSILDLLTDYHANGGYETLKANVQLLDDEDYAIIVRITNLGRNAKSEYKYITKDAYEFLGKSKLYPDDIVMSKITDPGTVYYVPELNKPMSLAMNLFLLRLNKSINSLYIYYYLDAMKAYVKQFEGGTATKTITKDAVKNLLIALPPLNEQKRIVMKIEELLPYCKQLTK